MFTAGPFWKTRQERRDISARGVPVSCLPRLLPYSKVMDLVKAVDRPPTIKCNDSIMPCYRYRLQDIVPCILQVNLQLGETNPSSLNWFGTPNVMKLAIGEDGAPLSQVCAMHIMLLSVFNFPDLCKQP